MERFIGYMKKRQGSFCDQKILLLRILNAELAYWRLMEEMQWRNY